MWKRSFGLGEAWVPLVAGLAWFATTSEAGWLAFALAAVPGSLLVAAGVASGLWPGDPRAHQHGAVAALLGVLLGPIAFLWVDLGAGLLLIALSALAFLAVGALSARAIEPVEDVPEPRPSARLAAEVALDETVLWAIVSTASRQERWPHKDEIAATLSLYRERGWLEKPEDFHRAPPALERVETVLRSFRGTDYEHLTFESGYEPRAEDPGRDRYLGYAPCRTAHAWVLRQASPERPWLFCIHGLGMGWPLADFTAFPPSVFHRRYGLNVVYPVLPFHGPRRMGAISGEGFFSRDVVDTIHASAQIAWDLRRLVSWIRAQGGREIGVYGLSLGGFSTALLASFEEDLACAIPGIPAADFAWLIRHHTPPPLMRMVERTGVTTDQLDTLLRVVSPLELTPKIPRERRYLFAGTADRITPADPVRRLWLHWERPKTLWYEGSHIGGPFHREVRDYVREALRESGLVA